MEEDHWTQPPTYLELQPNRVDVWRVSLNLVPASTQWEKSILSTGEIECAAKFRFEKDRHRFVLAHVYLRKILSCCLHCDPE